LHNQLFHSLIFMPEEQPSIISGLSDHSLSPIADAKFYAAQIKTAWGRVHQRRHTVMAHGELLASAVRYDLAGTLDGRPLRICGVGSVVVKDSDLGQRRMLIDDLLNQAARSGAEMALLFSRSGLDDDALKRFETIDGADVILQVAESPRHGAPMTMVRGGEERDLPAIAAMGRIRAEPFRFHLDRDADYVQYAITRQRLRAGLGASGQRQLQFFIAEEGVTAAAYVVISVQGTTWTLEECGDRDASGARVGALLQALIAREPTGRRPTIRGWLPPGFLPPQLTVVSTTPSREIMMIRRLGATPAVSPPLRAADVLYWRNDIF
jgi:hypothetical protein